MNRVVSSCCALLVVALIPAELFGQPRRWVSQRIGMLEYQVPEAYSTFEFGEARGHEYREGELYITVTSRPDTASRPRTDHQDYNLYYMINLDDAARKLKGRVRMFRDTIINNIPAHISRTEVSMRDGRSTNYHLLQILYQDSLRGFGCQYFDDRPAGKEVCARFFSGIGFVEPNEKKFPLVMMYIAGGVLLLLTLGYFVYRRYSSTGRAGVQPG